MADFRNPSGGHPNVPGSKGTTQRDGERSHSMPTGSSTFGSASRGVRSTRTATVPKDSAPHRSQTTPASGTDHHTRKTLGTTTTLLSPKTDQRSPKKSTQSSSRAPEVPNSRNLLTGADYRIEPLSGEQKDGLWLSPPAPSMPSADLRQSGSSFQTEPSSYYSADDNVLASGPPPMPDPKTLESHYESLWQAAQAPSMPIPNPAFPPLPSPYEKEGRPLGHIQNSEDKTHGRNMSTMSQHDPRDTYDSSWLAAPSPGMPAPSTASHPPHSTARPAGEGIPELNNRPSYRVENNSDEAKPEDNITPTAPLRIHHNHHHTHRPTATAHASTTSPTTASRLPAESNVLHGPSGNAPSRTQTGQTITSNFSGQTGLAASRPVGPTGARRTGYDQPANVPPKLQAAAPPRPTTSSPSAGAQTSTPILQNPSRFNSNALAQSKPTTTHAVSSAPAQSSSIYAQHTTSRLDSQAQGNGATKQPVHTTPTTTSTSRLESRPTAHAHTASSTAAPNPSPVPNQSINQSSTPHSESNPRPAGAAPSAFSTSIPQKPTQVQTQQQSTHNGRSHVTETSRPQTISAPQPQAKPSTSVNSKMKEKQEAAAKAAAATASMPTRPHMHGNFTQMDTQYVNMMLALDDIPTLHNILVGFFNWILLAGFILFPGTFTSLQNLGPDAVGQIGQDIIHSVTQLPLYIVAWVCCAVGAGGMIWMWWRWRKNYLWGLNKIFVPGLMNSLAGLLSTLANIYGAQHGQYSSTSKSTLIVTGVSTAIFLIFSTFYTLWLVRRVKARHDEQVGKERAGKYGEGVVDLSKRKP